MPPLLAVIGDVHAHWRRLRVVLDFLSRRCIERRGGEASLSAILLVGDLACAGRRSPPRRGYLRDVERVLQEVRELGVPVAWVPGNHDLPDLELPGNLDHGALLEVGGLRVRGIGGAGPARFGFAYEWSEEDIRRRTIAPWDILLAHCPPVGSPLARTRRGADAGSAAVAERIAPVRGVLACGHIHEAWGVGRHGECLMVNAGGLGAPYGAAGVGFIRGKDAVCYIDVERDEGVALARMDPAPRPASPDWLEGTP